MLGGFRSGITRPVPLASSGGPLFSGVFSPDEKVTCPHKGGVPNQAVRMGRRAGGDAPTAGAPRVLRAGLM